MWSKEEKSPSTDPPAGNAVKLPIHGIIHLFSSNPTLLPVSIHKALFDTDNQLRG